MDPSSLSQPFRSQLRFEVSNFLSKNCPHIKDFELQSMSHGVDVIVPDKMHLPNEIKEHLGSNYTYYNVKQLPVHCLVNKEFIEAFIKKGKFHLMSVNKKIDIDNCIAVLPTGVLILKVEKDTYEELGLQGQPSQFNYKKPKKFIIKINLTDDNFTPGKRGYDRTLQRLENQKDLLFDCLMVWIPEDDRVCSSSIAAYFADHVGLGKTQPCNVSYESKVRFSSSVPVVKPEIFNGNEECANFHDVFDWIGIMTGNMDDSSGENFMMSCLDEMPKLSCAEQVVCARWRGFFVSQQLVWLVEKLREMLNTLEIPWVCFVVHGFDDSPVSWGETEHGFHKSGDNLTAVVLFSDGYYWKYKATATHDILT